MTRSQKAAAVVVVLAAILVLLGHATFDQWAPLAAQLIPVFQ